MAVPKRRTSKTKRNKRRAHDALRPANWITCPNCQEAMLRHRACTHCGEYRGRKVLDVQEA
jgi:large subunit ribosomal protein L32